MEVSNTKSHRIIVTEGDATIDIGMDDNGGEMVVRYVNIITRDKEGEIVNARGLSLSTTANVAEALREAINQASEVLNGREK